ncbi:MAG TPA: hypothetical protein VK986_17080 [Tepidisphaeraceae bacterium]|nr:hypothetical protein [Tepidisphaeraceae bacterium]
MASLRKKLETLWEKADEGEVEVEDLTAFAVRGDRRAADVIRGLAGAYRWPRRDKVGRKRFVPLGRWADVVGLYLEGGAPAMVAYARRRQAGSFAFAVHVLEEVRSAAAVRGMAELARGLARSLPKRVADGVMLADAINRAMSFENPPRVGKAVVKELRVFLHRLGGLKLSEPQRAAVACALRGVGDAESAEMVRAWPRFTGPWAGLEGMVERAVGERKA